MAGYTLEQLKQMGAQPVVPTKPVGLTLEELQAKEASRKSTVVEDKESYTSMNPFKYISTAGENIANKITDSASTRRQTILESAKSSDPLFKKGTDIAMQSVLSVWDTVGSVVSGLIPDAIKDRIKSGSDKINDNLRQFMEEEGYAKPTPIGQEPERTPGILESISNKLGEKISQPIEEMSQTSHELLNNANTFREKAKTETDPRKKNSLLEQAQGMETASQNIQDSIASTNETLGSLARSTDSARALSTLLTATPKTPTNIKTGTGKIYDLTLDEADGLWKTVTQSTPEQLEQQIAKFYSKAVKPSVAGKMTIPQANKAIGNQIVAISLINKNIPKLKFIENGVEIVGRAPESMQELADAVSQTKADIFDRYNKLAVGANQKGATVELNSIADELEKIANNPVIMDNEKAIAKYAADTARAYRARGAYDIMATQEVIKLFNEKLKAFYRAPSPEYTSKAVVDSMIVNKLRELADAIIEKAEGAGYGDLKRQYGALKAIEREVVHRAIVEARKSSKGLLDFVDIASGAQVINWVVTGNIGALLQAGGMKAIAEYYKYLNSVSYNLRKLFEASARLQKNAVQPKSVAKTLNPSTTNKTAPTTIAKGGKATNIKKANTSNKAIPKSTTKAPVKSSLLQEAKGKSLEEFVKAQGIEEQLKYQAGKFDNGSDFLRNNEVKIPINKIYVGKGGIEAGYSGRPSVTKRNIDVNYYPHNEKIGLTDGNHRLYEAVKRGETEINARVTIKNEKGLPINKTFWETNKTKSQLTDIWKKANGK